MSGPRGSVIPCRNCGTAFRRTHAVDYCGDFCRFVHKMVIIDDCWVWQAKVDRQGYGSFRFGREIPAHRASLMLHGTDVPRGMDVDHLCRNTSCVNPSHLEVVTRRENALRGVHPNSLCFQMNRCMRGHAYTPENTVTFPSVPGKRQCRTCQQIASRARAARLRSAS